MTAAGLSDCRLIKRDKVLSYPKYPMLNLIATENKITYDEVKMHAAEKC